MSVEVISTEVSVDSHRGEVSRVVIEVNGNTPDAKRVSVKYFVSVDDGVGKVVGLERSDEGKDTVPGGFAKVVGEVEEWVKELPYIETVESGGSELVGGPEFL